jgi:lipoprotein-anchoring transpeptidase ErfK/SrfK
MKFREDTFRAGPLAALGGTTLSGGGWLRTCLAVAFAVGLGVTANDAAHAQGAPLSAQKETIAVLDEPGRVPAEGEEITTGPFARQLVLFRTNEKPGTVIIHTSERFLYLVQENGRALRYGIGVGREGFQWSGLVKIVRKAEWPDWRPPPEMIERQPYLPRFMAGGPAIRWARAVCISAERSIASTGPTSPRRSGMPCRLAVSAWRTAM